MPGICTLEETKIKTTITSITPSGIWLLSDGLEYFIDFVNYPFFKDAKVNQILNIQTDILGNFHWPELDADIEKESLIHPEKYPLKSII